MKAPVITKDLIDIEYLPYGMRSIEELQTRKSELEYQLEYLNWFFGEAPLFQRMDIENRLYAIQLEVTRRHWEIRNYPIYID